MCSVNDAGLDDVSDSMERKSIISIGEICKKCSERKAEVVLRIRDAYCRDCFLASATHKFRASLGKSKLVRPQDHILMSFSGSQSSVALLHLIKSGLNEATRKRLLFTCSVIHIDEGAVLGLCPEERKKICLDIIQQIKAFNLPYYVTPLESTLGSSEIRYYTSEGDSSNIDYSGEEQLKKLVNSVHSMTAKEDLIQMLRNQLLLKIAKELKCNKIFTADTASHLAVKLLSNVSLGRGAQLPLDIGFCDTRDLDVMLLRPLRDFMKKEIVFYNIFNNLKSITVPSLGTKADPQASIQKLTEKFITDLQENFPATVSTVFRTGDKLSMGSFIVQSDDECCALCQAPLDTTTTESSALQATEFSRLVSTLGPSGFDDKLIGTLNSASNEMKQSVSKLQEDKLVSMYKNCCDSKLEVPSSENENIYKQGEDCECTRRDSSISLSQVETCFCYSCRLIGREMETLEALPKDMILKIKEWTRYKEMREEIQDFLL